MMLSLSVSQNRTFQVLCRAGFSRLIRLTLVISSRMLRVSFQSQQRTSYFSEFKYSSLPGMASATKSSKGGP